MATTTYVIPTPRILPEEKFRHHQRLLYKVCHTFRNRFGGRFEEILSDAYPHYHKAVETWNPLKGTLEKRVTSVVYYMLIQERMGKWQEEESLPTEELEEGEILDHHSSFDLDRFVDGLDSRDAKSTVKMLLDMEPAHVPSREGLISQLLQKEDWTKTRLRKLWQDVQESLEDVR